MLSCLSQRWLIVAHQINGSHYELALYLSMVSLSISTCLHSHIFVLFRTFQGASPLLLHPTSLPPGGHPHPFHYLLHYFSTVLLLEILI